MNLAHKHILFDEFIVQNGEQYNQIGFILKFLESYPEVLQKLSGLNILAPRHLYQSQLEWVSLVHQLKHPLEVNFFQKNWYPIQEDDYDYFIDFNENVYSLFRIDFFPFDPYKWFRVNMFEDITELFLSIDKSYTFIDEQVLKSEKDKMTIINKLFKKPDDKIIN